MLHRDVDGVKVQRSQQQSFSHSRNNTLTLNPSNLSALSAASSTPSATPSQSGPALSTPSLRPSHLALPEPTAGDESPLSITRRQSSVQLSKRDLAAISDEDESMVAQYTGNGRSGWRGRPVSASAASLPAHDVGVERTQSLSVLSPLPEVAMERGVSDRQYSSSTKRVQPINTPTTLMHATTNPQLNSGSLSNSSSPGSAISPGSATHPRFKTRAPIRSWKERPNSMQAKDELLRTARRYGSGLAGEGAEAVKARKRAMIEEKEQERTRGTGANGNRAVDGGGEKEEEERKEGRLAGGGDFSGMGPGRRYEDDEEGGPNNRVLSWLRHDNHMKTSSGQLQTTDSISVSEDDGDDRQGRKVKSTVDRLQASLSKGRRKVIGIPSKLREMMSLHPKGAGKIEKEDGKEERKGEEEDSEDSQKDRVGPSAGGAESRGGSGSGDEHHDLMTTTESAMLNPHNAAPSSSALSSSANTPPTATSTLFPATSTSNDNSATTNNNRYDGPMSSDDDTHSNALRVDVPERPFASAPVHRSPPARSSPPTFPHPSHRRSRSIDSTNGYKPSAHNLSPRGADDSVSSSSMSSTASSRRSSFGHDNTGHSASFDSLPTLRTKSALGGKGSVGFAGVVGKAGRVMRARERFSGAFDRVREEERAMEAGNVSDAASDTESLSLSASQLLSPLASSKLSDLYSLQQQHIALLEAQIAELSSSHDSLRQQLDDSQRTRGRTDWEARLDALETHMEKIKQSQNRQFRAIYEQLNEVRGSGLGGGSGGAGGGSGWVWDVLLNVFTWFVTGLAFVSQPFTYLLSGRLGGWWGASGGSGAGKGKRATPVPKIGGSSVTSGGALPSAVSANSSPALTGLTGAHDRGGRDDSHRERDRDSHRERERSSRVTERVGGGGRRHEPRDGSLEKNRGGDRDWDRESRERRNRSRDTLDVAGINGRREGRGSREIHL